MTIKRIQVAVGIIQNKQAQVLIGQRTVKDAYYQKWEFPGGKLEQGETAEQALVRELQEELGINVHSSAPFMTIEHDYPDREVSLHVLKVTEYSNNPQSKEGQAIQWVDVGSLNELDFLEGNKVIFEKLLAVNMNNTAA